jgi:signal transduction histidine kinase/DNA-binding response OmpR family regulator
MWVTTQEARKRDPDFRSLSEELTATASRDLILSTTIAAGFCIFARAAYLSGQVSEEFLALMLLTVLTFGGSLWLLNRRLLAGQLAWLAGFAITVTVSIFIFRLPEIAFLYALIPFMAVTMIGWQAGLISGGIILGVLAWLANLSLSDSGFSMVVVSTSMLWTIVFASLLSGLIGWSAVSPLLVMLEWSSDNYRTAMERLEEARSQRMELHQVQEDLVHANNELSRLSSRLQVMTERAEDARRTKEEFVANVSHELRTPLNMIIGYTDLIMKSPQVYGKRLSARLLADISSIQRNSQHLVELINDVLDLSQVDAGRMALTKRWTSIQEVLEGAIIAVRPLFESKGLYLKIESPGEPRMVYCDRTRLREVALNLLSNAGRITTQGGVVVRVVDQGNHLVVSVQDTGPGITPEDQVKIFEPFSQLDRMLNHRTGGSGLGLSISKRFVELHNGKMWFESQLGLGTTFYFSIPVGEPSDLGDLKPGLPRWINRYVEYIPRTRPNKAPLPEYVPRIMIVEKERNVQRLFTRFADSLEIVPADSLEEAAQQLQVSPAQAVILNTQENVDGIAGVSAIPSHTPIITCWVPGKDEAALHLGVVQYLLKPARQEDLIAALDRFEKPGLNLLVVDDDPETMQLFARIISINRPGYHVTRASTGREALELMGSRHPDAVMLDLILPDLNGYQVLQEKAQDPAISAIPVIIVSSNDPVGVPMISDQFVVRRTSGLSVQEFMECILAVAGTLNAELRKPGPLPPAGALESPASPPMPGLPATAPGHPGPERSG